jgi:phosphoglycolate phosphatase
MENGRKLILFDFDGVLVDSLAFYERMVNLCLESLGEPLLRDRQEYLDIFESNFYTGISRRGVDVAAFTRVSAQIAPTLDYDEVRAFEGLKPVLEALRQRHILLVVSSNSSGIIEKILLRDGLDRYFEDILGLEFKLSKIDKIRDALAHFQARRQDTYYIGDTAGDIREARQAGVRTVAVTWGWHSHDKLALTEPDYLVDTPEALLQIQ